MQRKISRASRPLAVKALTAFAVAAAFSNAGAAGLGKLTVLSSLGQPLRAEIELTSVSKDEADSLAAKLASTQAFKQANVDFNPALMSLRFNVEHRGARQFIRITSSQPINEPYVGMLIELASSKGRLLREYTFLLDPAEIRQPQTATMAASTAAPTSISQLPPTAQVAVPAEKQDASDGGKPARKGRKGAAKAKSADNDKAADGKNEYRVRSGDTLGTIASWHKHEGVSLDQMLVSIYRANPDAFIGNNMNRLKTGKVMTIPDAAAAGSVSPADARNVIVAQSGNFDQYRNKLAGMVEQAPSQQGEQSSQAAGGKITAKVNEQPTAANRSVDRLKLSKENAGAADSRKSAGVVSAEDKLSQDKSMADSQARIRELEKNIKELQGLLELKSKDLAVQQKQAEVASGAKPAAAPGPEAAPAAAQAAAAAPTPAPAATPQPAPEAKPKMVTPPPPPPPPPSLMDDVLGNPTMLGGIGAALLGVVFLVWRSLRRRRQVPDLPSRFMAEPNTESPNSLFGTTGGQSVNTNNSVFNSSFSPSSMQVDANEVDPIAEADVYIAYGREAQAVEILKDALRAQPERNAVRIKLLEIYASQNDLISFDALASELYSMTKGQGDDWAYAAKMGVSIDPKNPMYTGASDKIEEIVDKIAEKPAALHAFTNPIDELDPDSLTAPSRMTNDSSPRREVAAKPVKSELEAVDTGKDQWADLPLDILDFGGAPAKKTDDIASPDLKLDEPFERKPEPAKSENLMPDLSFDILDTPAPAASESIPNVNDDAGLEFKTVMNFPSPEQESVEKAAPVSVDNIDTASVGDLDFVNSAFGKQEQVPAAPVPLEFSATDTFTADSPAAPATADVPELEVESKVAAVPAQAASDVEAVEFDFSSINLDLGNQAPESPEPKPASMDAGKSAANMEMATKLDLAVAYMEIGDKEGARELLEEVVKGGSAEQVEKAKETLAKMR